MRDKFWLIQRGGGSFQDPNTATEFFGPGNEHLISGDYMGYAEFEWGAIPRAFRRIMDNYDKYSLHVTDVTTARGVPFCLFCRDEFYEDIIREIRRFIAVPYPLKEFSNLQSHFVKNPDRHALKTNFWWCIDRVYKDSEPDEFHIGDWIGFIGATDRQKAMQRVLDHSYHGWWEQFSDADRKAMLKDAYR